MALGSKVNLRRLSKPHPDGYKWIATYRDGEKIRKRYFRLKKDAVVFKTEREDEALNSGRGTLTSDEKAACLKFRAELDFHGATVHSALVDFLRRKREAVASCSVAEAVSEFIAEKERKQLAEPTLNDYRYRLGAFAEVFGGESVSAVSAAQIADYLHGLKSSPATMANHRRLLSVLFNFAVRRKWCQSNPAAEVELPKPKDRQVGILAPQQTASLLEAADVTLVPRLALAIFAGVRREELDKLDWQAIDLERGVIRITGDVAKGGRKRQLPIAENLKSWLEPHWQLRGNVSPTNCRRLMDAARKAAGFRPTNYSTDPTEQKRERRLQPWPANAMRHSFGSYRLEQCQNAAQVALEMGNSPGMIFRHYRELVLPEDCERFWQLRPASKSKVTQIA